jgi:hypothetical protein
MQFDRFRTKGFFSWLKLPVAKEYIYPTSRNMMFFVGGIGALLVLGLFAFNATVQQGQLVSNGPLSSNHAAFGGDCSTCHTPFQDVTSEKCSTCHEKFGDEVGVHTFASHYLYRSDDFTRIVVNPDEPACFGCHTEHVGRDNPITAVADDNCLQCHAFDSFNTEHPEFDFAADSLLDDGNLKFPHTLHVNQVRDRENLGDLEQTCLYCHNATPDGTGFQPISFENHCDTCHLTTSDATPWIATASAEGPGVLTLETLRAQQRPGSLWTYYTNPNEFQNRGATVRKTPIYHRDPWVLENLRRVRQIIYPSRNGLADLLRASGDVDPREVRTLYEEAIATLGTYADELRASPEREVQQELAEIEDLLKVVRRRLRDPYAPLDETKFLVSPAERDTSLSADDVRAYQRVVDQLTQACQKCHYVEDATIVRVQADQGNLVRAEFDHGAHIIHTRCLDCHTAIPIRESAATNTPAEWAEDNAGIQNLPSIAKCQTCHDDGKASNTCVTCHDFHPDKSQHSNLLQYLE